MARTPSRGSVRDIGGAIGALEQGTSGPSGQGGGRGRPVQPGMSQHAVPPSLQKPLFGSNHEFRHGSGACKASG
jgi:hypothetical protein